MTKHIVITGPNELQAVCDMAVERGYTHVWIHPLSEMEYVEKFDTDLLSAIWDNPVYNYQFKTGTPNNHLVSVYARKHLPDSRKSHSVLVTFLAYSPWNWQDLSSEKILELSSLLEEKLGVPMGSPGMMGMKYVQKIVTKYHPKWLTRPEADLSQFKFTQPLVWGRIPTQEELQRKYAYYLDRNSSYPRVGVAEKFGVGEPVHYPHGCEFDKRLPGMWRIGVYSAPEMDERLPHPLYRLEGREWLPTAIVSLLSDKEVVLDIKEAIVFPKREFVFKDSIENLWGIRSSYAKGTPERNAFKNVMNSLVGSTSAGFDNWKNRPDWYTQFVSCARNVVYRNIFKLAANDNMYPVLCQNDALLYLSDEETPEQALPSMNIKDSLGCYKLELKIEVTDKVREILTTDKIKAPGMRVHYLKELKGE
jgi:hypothetical protein